jgi:hypothetical protein
MKKQIILGGILVAFTFCGGASMARDLVGNIVIPRATNGLSAYELWLQQGNSGTLAQFLASLKGDPGVQGDPGARACAPVLTPETGTGTNAGCMRVKIQAMKGTSCGETDGSAAHSSWVCHGQNGTSVVIKGTKATCGDLPTTGNTIGDIWLVSGQNYLGYMWTGTTWNCPSGGIQIQGPSGCTPEVSMTTNSSDSNCYDVTVTPKVPDGNGGCTTTGAASATTQTLCSGYDPCKGLTADVDKKKTVKGSTRVRTNPSSYQSEPGYFTSIGYYTVATTYCSGSKSVKELDSCEVLSVGGGLRNNTSVCANGTYYECSWPTGETSITGVTSGKYRACVTSDVSKIPTCAAIIGKTTKANGCYYLTKQDAEYNPVSGKCEGTGTATNIEQICDGTCADKIVVGGKNTSTGCYTTSYYHQTLNSSGVCTSDSQPYDTKDTCDGPTGPQGPQGPSGPVKCPERIYATAKNTSTGCYNTMKILQEWNGTSCVDKSGATAETLGTTCDGDDGDVCDGVASADLAKTVKRETKTYIAPTGVTTSTYTTAYATAVGGNTVVTDYCSGSPKTIWVADSCTNVTSDTTAISGLPKCDGTISKCARGDDNTTYYMCSISCQKSKSTYTQPTIISGTDSNCANSGKCASAVGKITTAESDGCGTGAVSKNVAKEDTCTDPKILTSGGTAYTYYTCTVGDSSEKVTGTSNATTYTLRKPLENNGAFKIINDTKTTTESLNTTVNDTTNGLVKKVNDNTSALANKANSSDVYTKSEVNTALGNKLNTADLSSTLTKTMITGKLGNNTYGSYSDVNDLKTTVGDSSGGLVKDVADAASAAATADGKAVAAQNTANSKIGQTDLNNALYGSGGTAANPASGSIAANANSVSGKLDADALYGSGGTAANPASGSIAANANSALQAGSIEFSAAASNWLRNGSASVQVGPASDPTSRPTTVQLNQWVSDLANIVRASGLCNATACTNDSSCAAACANVPSAPVAPTPIND